MRNLLIAAGNAGQPELIALINPYLGHGDAGLRAMAIWALSRYLDKDSLAARPEKELDREVAVEWQNALSDKEQGVSLKAWLNKVSCYGNRARHVEKDPALLPHVLLIRAIRQKRRQS